MWKRAIVVLLIVSILLVFMGCCTHIHKIGSGPAGNNMIEARQWYVLWGLIPINEVDSHAMAGGATNYEIRTEVTPIDFVIGMFVGVITVNSRTVTVTK
jgi:hypothetical protein